ncbi:MAG TPA: DoxX family protein [Rhizomicrobium sp.]|nr:DoxX family protein [Rhizomicrobium sp.]
MSEDLGKLVARLSVGVLLLFHGVHKLLTGIAPIKQMLAGHHLPEALSYGAYFGEIVAPALIVLGLFARLGGGLVVINMLVAIYLVGMHQLLAIGPMGGYALELEMFYLFGGLIVALLGAGRLSVGGVDGPLN